MSTDQRLTSRQELESSQTTGIARHPRRDPHIRLFDPRACISQTYMNAWVVEAGLSPYNRSTVKRSNARSKK